MPLNLLISLNMGAPGGGTSFADFANTLRRLQDDAATQWNDIKNLDPETISKLKSLGLDLTQFGLDIAGIFDPTPTSDGIGTLFSLGRRDWFGAGASAFIAILPYAGDLAKAGKFGKYVKSVAEAIELAKTSEKARVLMTPIFRQLDTLIDVAKKVPYSQIESKALATYNAFERGRPWMMLTRVGFGINPKAVIRSAYDGMMKHLDDAQRQIDGFLRVRSNWVSIPVRQLERKWKHAVDFGITTTKRNADTLAQYERAIVSHLDDTATISHGTYLYVPGSEVFYNPNTNLIVVLDRTGTFVTGWKLEPGTPQFTQYINGGRLR